MYLFLWRVVTLHSLGCVSSTWRFLFGNTWTCERRAMVKKHEHVAHIKENMMYIIMFLISSLHGHFQTSHQTTNANFVHYIKPMNREVHISIHILKTGWCKARILCIQNGELEPTNNPISNKQVNWIRVCHKCPWDKYHQKVSNNWLRRKHNVKSPLMKGSMFITYLQSCLGGTFIANQWNLRRKTVSP